mmetsp:Transcript_36668/g.86751  ORF Transcript_36668/g.86751 Transcript_36668/m.86751 type:complete len:428 (-) Transcript_36668:1507-2790(-)
MEGVERHLCRRLADGLGCDGADRLARMHHRARVFEERQLTQRRDRRFLGLCDLSFDHLLHEVLDVVLVRLRDIPHHQVRVAQRRERLVQQTCLLVRQVVRFGILLDLLHVLSVRISVHALQYRRADGTSNCRRVVCKQRQPPKPKLLHRVDSVFAVEELRHAAVAVADRSVVRHGQRLQMLHQTPLQVPGPRGLDSRVDEPLTPSHAMKKVLLRPDPGQEPIRDKPTGPRIRLPLAEGRERLAAGHDRHALAFELLLPEETADLRHVDLGPLGAGRRHHLEVVLRERDHLACREDGVDHAARHRRERLLDAAVVELAPLLLVQQMRQRLVHGFPTPLQLAPLHLGTVVAELDLREVGRGAERAPVGGREHVASLLVRVGRDHEVEDPARERAVDLHEVREEAPEDGEQQPRLVRPVRLEHRVHEAVG